MTAGQLFGILFGATVLTMLVLDYLDYQLEDDDG